MVECDGLQIRIRKDTGGSNPLLCSKLELIFSILKKLRILKMLMFVGDLRRFDNGWFT